MWVGFRFPWRRAFWFVVGVTGVAAYFGWKEGKDLAEKGK